MHSAKRATAIKRWRNTLAFSIAQSSRPWNGQKWVAKTYFPSSALRSMGLEKSSSIAPFKITKKSHWDFPKTKNLVT
jgi:hypothetical protein